MPASLRPTRRHGEFAPGEDPMRTTQRGNGGLAGRAQQSLDLVFFGGVPQSILYDNDKCLVSRILSDGTRQRTRAFSGLQSHYLFEDRYGRPGKGNDKGNVEGVVRYGWCRKVGGKLENWRKLRIVKHSERRCAAAERSLRHETSYGIDVAQSIFR